MPSSRKALMADFANFHDDLQHVLEAAEDVSVWPIFDRERDDRWSGDRIVLLGDACHPMRPYMAAGGAMAIEDGAILSRCLANSTTQRRPSAGTRRPEYRVLPMYSVSPSKTAGCGTNRNGLVLLLRSMRGGTEAAELGGRRR